MSKFTGEIDEEFYKGFSPMEITFSSPEARREYFLKKKAPEMFELLKRAEALIPETYTDEHMLCEEIRQLILEIEGE